MRRVEHMTSSKEKSSNKNKGIGILIFCAAVILIAVGILGFRDGGWFRKSRTYDAQTVQSLTDYAQQLEKAGNGEAAAAVYELIAKYGDGDLIRKANEEIPVVKADNVIEQFRRFMSGAKGGDGR